ncbi:MAG: ester cyclase [Phreatobacter sp.]|uniref:ester cyclase n=1 Tax=Phreatobacter sp. TaxID=1966341 RepID=UPI001A4686CE|nr:nuclear transport factor 2 family protein [Phreatobacter sp.]MBL8571904.1 ester cyclase [Phreatobacter sp.]
MATKDENGACLARHLEAEGRHDMAVTLATLHPDCVFEDRPIGMTLHGREGARRHYELWWNAFGVVTEEGRLHWVRDDLAIGEAWFAGVHRGEFLRIPPTGRTIRFPFTVVVSFRDGLLAGERFTYDLNDILRQIGQPFFDTAQAA